jgi:hypothetical protein
MMHVAIRLHSRLHNVGLFCIESREFFVLKKVSFILLFSFLLAVACLPTIFRYLLCADNSTVRSFIKVVMFEPASPDGRTRWFLFLDLGCTITTTPHAAVHLFLSIL